MGKRIIEELATDTIQDNDFILMDNNTTPTGPDDDEAGTRKIRASEFGSQIITVDDELSDSSENPVQNKVITGAINTLASATEITGTASGSIASFDDGSTLPLKDLQVSIEPIQSGSGEPSPSNVRPISGWTECNVTVNDDVDNPTVENEYTIQFTDGTNPLTVYGGTLNVTTGVLTVDRVKISKKWSEFSKSELTVCDRGTVSLPQNGTYPPSSETAQKCNLVTWMQNYNTDTPHFYCNATQGIVLLPKGTDGNTDVELLYELATPQTYSLTPTAVASILGRNNVSVDTGDVLACEYVKDTDIVIKRLLYKDLTATLSANATSLTITDSAITTDATYDIFTDTYGVNPTAVSVSNGSMTLTFTARGSATKVKVRVML